MRRTVVVIGNFDGVHTGHQELLARARQRGIDLGPAGERLPLVVVTFWPHPASVVGPAERAPLLLSSLSDRIDLLRKYGADGVRVIQFTKEVASWSPEHFIDTILGPLHPVLVVVGENFRFGNKAAGTVDTLRAVGAGAGGFEVEAMTLVEVDELQTCSSLIRQSLGDGDVTQAARQLGRPFRVRGLVVVGDQRGRELGFPTANLPVGDEMAVPADGVYAGWLSRVDDPDAPALPAAISVGTNPTFNGLERRVESYVLDLTDLELYGIEIVVDFVAQLRDQIKFASVDELVAQMATDVANTRRVLGLPAEPTPA